jgi:2-polyprenyl-3-methyl-5-hydroxy-6-metoxy-1,4-benzoquinol methylase
MHAKGLFPGVTWRNVFDSFTAAILDLDRRTILDFGCGPRGGLAEQFGADRVVSYDPYVEAYSASPWHRPFDVVFSSDVLEHLPEQDIEAFAAHVLRSRPQFMFLNISTREAHKTFSTGGQFARDGEADRQGGQS